MKLRDYISISPGFNRSVNIKYDLKRPEKVSSYIPTQKAEEVFLSILTAARGSSNECASMLTGSYGTGKSHLATVLGSLLGKCVDSKYFLPIIEKIKDKDVKQVFEKELDTTKPYLVVTLSGGSSFSLDDQLKYAIKRALEENKIDIQISSSFKAALDSIETWKTSYPQTYELFSSEIQRLNKGSVDSFIERLNNFDSTALALFINIYPQLTSGAKFDHFDSDVAEIYKNVCSQLSDYGYRGLFLIFDEFNKVLDSSFDDNSTLKTLQDLAELAARSADDNRLNIVLISHRTIGQYIAQTSSTKEDEWRKIEGRFKIFDVSSQPWEDYELIGRVLQKKRDDFFEIAQNSNPTVQAVSRNSQLKILFDEMEYNDIQEIILKGCFPLHPATAFILPRISARLAQNARTLFTFLAGKDDSPINSALDASIENFKYIMPWHVYDYFEPQLSEAQDKGSKTIWKNVTTAINTLPKDADNEQAFLKTVGIFKIANVPCTREMVEFSLDSFSNAFRSLLEKKLIYVRRSTREIDIIEPVDFDVERKINSLITQKAIENPFSIIDRLNCSKYIIPYGYNYENKITRFLTPFYGNINNISALINDGRLLPEFNGLDGIICYLFPENNDEKLELEKIATRCEEQQVFFVIPNEPTKIQNSLLQLSALYDLIKSDAASDPKVKTLIKLYIDDIKQEVVNLLNEVTTPSSKVSYYWRGERQRKITSERALTRFVSECMKEIYSYAPKFNNELINKNSPTRISMRARNTVIDYLLLGKDLANIRENLKSYQEKFMYDTLFVKSNIFNHSERAFIPLSIEPVIKEIENFFLGARETERSFEELFLILISPPYGVRKGVIPVLLTVCILKYKNVVTIRDTTGVDCFIDASLIEQIVENPKDYQIVLSRWNEAHAELCKKIAEIFELPAKDDIFFSNKFGELGKEIFNWFTSLPRYCRETNQISEKARAFRSFAKQIIRNPKEIITEQLPEALGYKHFEVSDVDEIITCIKDYKNEIEQSIHSLKKRVFNRFRAFFEAHGGPEGTLVSLARNMCDSIGLSSNFNPELDSMFNYIKTFSGDDEQAFSCGLAHQLTGVLLEDWLDETYTELDRLLKELHNNLEQVATSSEEKPEYEIVISSTSEKIPFPHCEVSPLGEILQSHLKASLDDFGDAISTAEKKQILLNLLINM